MPRAKTIHYQHPRFGKGYHACGLGDSFSVQITSDPSQVTCKACLKTATGQQINRSPGRPPKGDMPKEKLTTRIDADLKQKAKDAGLNFAEMLEKAIRQELNE